MSVLFCIPIGVPSAAPSETHQPVPLPAALICTGCPWKFGLQGPCELDGVGEASAAVVQVEDTALLGGRTTGIVTVAPSPERAFV